MDSILFLSHTSLPHLLASISNQKNTPSQSFGPVFFELFELRQTCAALTHAEAVSRVRGIASSPTALERLGQVSPAVVGGRRQPLGRQMPVWHMGV